MNTSKHIRWITPSIALAAVGLGLVFTWPGSSPQAQVADAFTTLSVNCRDFDKVYMAGEWEGRGGLLHARSDGRIGIDPIGRRARVSWDGQVARYDNTGLDQPRRLEHLEPFIADLWSECRSGFANSTWVAQGPWEAGIDEPDLDYIDWARLDLPFAWAQGVKVFFGIFEPEFGEDLRLIVQADDEKPQFIAVREIDWDSDFPDQALLPDAPSFAPPCPEFWCGGPGDWSR